MLLENIKHLCKKNGETLSSLEKELGFGKGTISRWAKNSPSIENVRKVADHFGVSVDCLIADSDLRTNGHLTIYNGDLPVCRCRFDNMLTLLCNIKMYAKGDDIRVDIHKPKAEEMGQAVSYSAR